MAKSFVMIAVVISLALFLRLGNSLSPDTSSVFRDSSEVCK